jgi:hypothetical protein
MVRERRLLGLRLGVIGATFVAGLLCGSFVQHRAEAQLGDVMKKAGEAGKLGPVGELGTSIVDMQEHITALQKNLDTLKKVKTALGG